MAKSNAPEKIEKSIKNSKSGRLLSKDEKKGKNTPTSATNKRSHRISTSDLGRVNEVALSRKINGKSKNNTIVKADNFQNIADPKKGLPLILKNGEQDSLKVMSKSKSGFPLLFNTKRKEYIEQYLRGLIVIMRLQDWTITLDWSSSGDQDVYATIISSPDQKRATLNLTIKFLELDNSERAQTLVHELMHCHLFSLHYLTEKSIEHTCSQKVADMFLIGFDCEIEKATDAIADIIAPFVPKFTLPI